MYHPISMKVMRPDTILAAAVAAVVLIPYGTVRLPYRTGLVAQAAAMLAAVLVVLAAGLLRPGALARLRAVPRLAAAAVAAYALVAVLGGAVGLARGNPLALLAGQVLALGILPLAALALWALGAPASLRTVARAIVAAVAAGAMIHYADWARRALTRSFFPRMYFEGRIGVMDLALLALLLSLALFVLARGWRLLAAMAVLLVLAVAVVASGTRSLWTVAPVGVGLFLAAWALFGRANRLRAALVLVPAVALIATVFVLADTWYTRPRANLIPGRPLAAPVWQIPASVRLVTTGPELDGRPAVRWAPEVCRNSEIAVTEPFPVPGGGAYAFHALMLEEGGDTEAYVLVDWLDAAGQRCGNLILRAYPRRAWSWRETADVAPPGTAYARLLLGCKQYTTHAWLLADARLERLGAPATHAFFMQVRYLKRRLGGLLTALGTGASGEPSVVGRIAESHYLMQLYQGFSPGEKLLGQGLGAQYASPDQPGQMVSYIHNYYAFFVFKTGIAGAVLGCGALAVFAALPLLRLRRARDARDAALLWAVLAAWVSYLAWSLVCPEILDFRLAPLWGFIIAATATVGGTAAGEAGR
jgi:hypothetical protein